MELAGSNRRVREDWAGHPHSQLTPGEALADEADSGARMSSAREADSGAGVVLAGGADSEFRSSKAETSTGEVNSCCNCWGTGSSVGIVDP